MSAIYIMWLREVRRYTRSKAQIVTTIAQPVTYLLVMGFGMSGVFHQAGLGSYLQFVAPGILVMTVIFPAASSAMGVFLDRQLGFLQGTLVAPVPRTYIMLGRLLGVATVALLQGAIVAVICIIAGFRPVSLTLIPLAVAFLALIALIFAGVGLSIGSSMKTMQAFGIVGALVVMPLFFLSGAFYPLDHLPGALASLTHLNPLSYAVDGLRSALLAQSHFSLERDALMLMLGTVLFVSLGAWRFSRIEV